MVTCKYIEPIGPAAADVKFKRALFVHGIKGFSNQLKNEGELGEIHPRHKGLLGINCLAKPFAQPQQHKSV
ncbi:predicted protein [Coccidioides posadasii str. Silveira]|uniref:Predicted protein n=1 Tax=Coccidioides posadasii (strain RMSCC 757 / Silveira) TaxID=443226 RepID=E9D144_COCPS|nr:predicted protein [Coccidioides posadasii str. Silveira]